MQRQKLRKRNEPVGKHEKGMGIFPLCGAGRQDYDHTDAAVRWDVRPGFLGQSEYHGQGIISQMMRLTKGNDERGLFTTGIE